MAREHKCRHVWNWENLIFLLSVKLRNNQTNLLIILQFSLYFYIIPTLCPWVWYFLYYTCSVSLNLYIFYIIPALCPSVCIFSILFLLCVLESVYFLYYTCSVSLSLYIFYINPALYSWVCLFSICYLLCVESLCSYFL